MIPLIDTSQGQIANLATEMGFTGNYGQLVTPLTNYAIHPGMFALDNGGFTKQDMPAFRRLLNKARPHEARCKFVVCPDVPGSAIRTMELFDVLFPTLAEWPIALACQDGLENIHIPWHKLSAVFIAGTTEWKDSPVAEHIIRAAKWLGKWVHIGRVNTPDRWAKFEKMGADSCDGSGVARYSHMRQAIAARPIITEGANND